MALKYLLNTELTKNNIRILAQGIYSSELQQKNSLNIPRDRSPKPAKSLREVYELIEEVIGNYQDRANVPTKDRILFTEEEPLLDSTNEIITVGLVSRMPGSFGQGAPMEAKVKNLHFLSRGETDDPLNPGYRLVDFGYWHDNILRLTCWARTNKQANYRTEWLEGLFVEYEWYFKAEGVDRFLFWERQKDTFLEKQNNKWYGRPLDYFVRTETIKTIREKSIEEILLKYSTKIET
jgi:hypothetical protein